MLIDHDGIYDPCLVNDRLLLGLKGIMSEFEMATLRQRALEAKRMKAQRGELRLHLPIGFVYGPMGPSRSIPMRGYNRRFGWCCADLRSWGARAK